jgi:hypothetical protein
MRGSMSGVLALVAGLAFPGAGQQVPNLNTSGAKDQPSPRLSQLPYTATYRETWVRRLSNGGTRTDSVIQVEARDSQQRRLTSSTSYLESGVLGEDTVFSLHDNLARTDTQWLVVNSVDRIHRAAPYATVTHLSGPEAVPPACNGPARNSSSLRHAARPLKFVRSDLVAKAIQETVEASLVKSIADDPVARTHQAFAALRAELGAEFRAKPPGPDSDDREDLGRKTIRGIEVHGIRFISKVPAGTPDYANGEPGERVFEQWTHTAPGLRSLMVLQIINDPQVNYTKELVDFTLGEPDSALFKPPANYEFVDQKPQSCPAQEVNMDSSKPKAGPP